MLTSCHMVLVRRGTRRYDGMARHDISCNAMISLSVFSEDDDGFTNNVGGKEHSQGKERRALGWMVPIYPIRSMTMIHRLIMFVSLALTDENSVRALSLVLFILARFYCFGC